jgi:hypothetical protein
MPVIPLRRAAPVDRLGDGRPGLVRLFGELGGDLSVAEALLLGLRVGDVRLADGTLGR